MDKRDELRRDLVTTLAGELATVAGALLGGSATAAPGTGPAPAGWVVACRLEGGLEGTLTLTVGEQDATALARRLMGMTEDPPADAVADTLSEVAGQAAGSLSQLPVAAGAKIRVGGAPELGAPPAAPASVFDVTMDDGMVFRFGCWADLAAAPETVVSAPASVAPSASRPAPAAPPPAPAPQAPDNLDVILDIELPLTVRFGRTEMTLQSLTKIGPGSVIDLDRSPDEPIEVLVNDKVIARGEVVVVAGNYGVRITEVVSAADRIRTLGN